MRTTKVPRFMTLTEVCESTGLSKTTLRRYIADGKLNKTQISRKILLNEAEVIALLNGSTVRHDMTIKA